jgi:hypothetical protein
VAPNEETAMSPTAVPSRITIDFRDAAMPSRTWILGVDEAATDRLELIAFEGGVPAREPSPRPRPGSPAAVVADCACPEFCERDHANE